MRRPAYSARITANRFEVTPRRSGPSLCNEWKTEAQREFARSPHHIVKLGPANRNAGVDESAQAMRHALRGRVSPLTSCGLAIGNAPSESCEKSSQVGLKLSGSFWRSRRDSACASIRALLTVIGAETRAFFGGARATQLPLFVEEALTGLNDD